MTSPANGKKKRGDDGFRRARGPRALAEMAAAVTRPVFDKRGLAGGAVAADWPTIVGARLAEHSLPEKIAYAPNQGSEGTLHLRIDSGSFAAELQHLAPLLIERVNAYFGYRAVGRIKLTQGPLPERPHTAPPSSPRPLAEGEAAALDAALDDIEDPELRARLAELGRNVLGGGDG